MRCVCVWLGVGGDGLRGLGGLDFTIPVGTGEVLDVCPCFGFGGVGRSWGVGGGLDQGLEGWGSVMSV